MNVKELKSVLENMADEALVYFDSLDDGNYKRVNLVEQSKYAYGEPVVVLKECIE